MIQSRRPPFPFRRPWPLLDDISVSKSKLHEGLLCWKIWCVRFKFWLPTGFDRDSSGYLCLTVLQQTFTFPLVTPLNIVRDIKHNSTQPWYMNLTRNLPTMRSSNASSVFLQFQSLRPNWDLSVSSSLPLMVVYSLESLPLFPAFQEDSSTHHGVQPIVSKIQCWFSFWQTFSLTEMIIFCALMNAPMLEEVIVNSTRLRHKGDA